MLVPVDLLCRLNVVAQKMLRYACMHKALFLGSVTSDIYELPGSLKEIGETNGRVRARLKKGKTPQWPSGERNKDNCLSLAVHSNVVDNQEVLPCISSWVMHFHVALLKVLIWCLH